MLALGTWANEMIGTLSLTRESPEWRFSTVEINRDGIFENLEERENVFLLQSRGSFGYFCFTFKSENLVSLGLIPNPFVGRHVLA